MIIRLPTVVIPPASEYILESSRVSADLAIFRATYLLSLDRTAVHDPVPKHRINILQ